MSLVNRYQLSLIVLLVISSLALYLRLESVTETQVINPIRADAREYFNYAYNLRIKHVYSAAEINPDQPSAKVKPDSTRPPVYPLFLSLFVNGLPDRPMLGKILLSQAILSALTVAIAFIFFRGFLYEPWALFACFLTAIGPHLIVANSYLLTETLFCFLLVLFAWLASSVQEMPSPKILFVSGITLGLATLVRSSVQYFPLTMVFLLLFQFGWRRGSRSFMMLLFGFLLVLAPWLVRNLVVLHRPADRTLMINFLHHGMYPNFTYDHEPKSYGFPYRFDPRSAKIGEDVTSVLHEIAERFQRKPFDHFVWFFIGKPIAFWSWNIVQGMGDVFIYPVAASPYFDNKLFKLTHNFMYFLHWPLVCLGLLSSLLVWIPFFEREFSRQAVFVARFTSLLLLYFTILHMIGAPFPRYSVPLRPFLYGMALLPLQLSATKIKSLLILVHRS